MSVQQQITELKHQLDSLYQTVEQIQISLTLSNSLPTEELANLIPKLDASVFDLEFSVGGNGLQHKDVLFDESANLEGYPMDEKSMSPELQIKRLTAQLTVAYKRIAQLEEQLLSRQNVHNGSEYIYS